MDNLTKRFILFLFLCIPSRALITYTAFKYPEFSLTYLKYPAYLISFGFIFIFIFNLRKVGAETFNEPIWWNHLRPLHSILWLLFALTNIWQFLATDTLIGLLAFLSHHIM